MKARLLVICLLVPAAVLFSAKPIKAQSTAFLYQGSLKSGESPANGNFDFEFKLFDAPSGGSQLGSAVTVLNVAVINGGFAATLDFGSQFPGAARYVEIGVRTAGGGGGYQQLLPRQQIASVPYGIRSLTAANADSATNAATAQNALNLGGVAANEYVVTTDPRLTDPRTPTPGSANYIQNTTTQQLASNFNISGTGKAGIFDAVSYHSIAGFRVLAIPGTGNAFAGLRAGNLTLTGSHNASLGYLSGESLTTGYNNAFVGSSSGFNNTTGFSNTLVGYTAGYRNTTGSGNSMFGVLAGYFNETGTDNAFFGVGAGRNSGGSENSFFGPYAGEYHGNGSGNTFLGRFSGVNNSTGDYNIAIGYNSGFSSDGFTYATAIGTDAFATASNQISLGRGNGADTVRIPGPLNVTGPISGNGSGLTNMNAGQFTTGILPVNRGGTGTGNVGFAGYFLRSNGSIWIPSPIGGSDVPAGSAHYIQNSLAEQPMSNFTISGTGTVGGQLNANTVNVNAGYNLGNLPFLKGSASSISAGRGAGTTSGLQNSFFGAYAGEMNTGEFANNNSFFGYGSGRANVSSGSNSFFGSFSGQESTAVGNSFFGYASGGNTTTGGINTFIGMNAGLGNSTGSSNTALGFNADLFGGGLTNATAIGANARVSQSNSMVLGSINGINGATADTNVGIGTTAPTERLHVVGDGLFTGNVFGYSLYTEFLGTDGDVAVCLNTSSDRLSLCSSSLRYKSNISNFTAGLELVRKLRPIAFDWNKDGGHDVGFAAEEVAEIEPRFIVRNHDGQVEGVKYDRITVVLVNAVKEQQAEIEVLRRQLDEERTLMRALKRLLCERNAEASLCKK